MKMDDQFLHRLRRDPPAGFATRLKWQLDRPPALRSPRSRILLVFAIFGTAFALVAPPSRRVLGELFEQPASSPATRVPSTHRAQSPSTASAVVGEAADQPPIAAPPFVAQPVASAAVTQPVTAPSAAEPASGTPDAAPIADTPVRPNFVISSGSSPLTPQVRAQAAVDTRRALFRLLAVVIEPLSSTRAGRIPVDVQTLRNSTHRLQVLAAMIPDVFSTDTRTFDISTGAQDLIWTQPAGFAAKTDALTAALDMLAQGLAGADEDGTRKAIHQVELACNACHDVYRRN
jgi:cytochrome c556